MPPHPKLVRQLDGLHLLLGFTLPPRWHMYGRHLGLLPLVPGPILLLLVQQSLSDAQLSPVAYHALGLDLDVSSPAILAEASLKHG